MASAALALSSRIDVPVTARNAPSSVSVLVCSFSSADVPWATICAVIDDGDAVGDAVRLVHVMRGEEDGDVFGLVEMLDVGPELIAGLRIEAERGLVEKKNFGSVQQTARDFESALHASGKFLHEFVAAIPQLEKLEQSLDALDAYFARHMVEDAVKIHVLVGG